MPGNVSTGGGAGWSPEEKSVLVPAPARVADGGVTSFEPAVDGGGSTLSVEGAGDTGKGAPHCCPVQGSPLAAHTATPSLLMIFMSPPSSRLSVQGSAASTPVSHNECPPAKSSSPTGEKARSHASAPRHRRAVRLPHAAAGARLLDLDIARGAAEAAGTVHCAAEVGGERPGGRGEERLRALAVDVRNNGRRHGGDDLLLSAPRDVGIGGDGYGTGEARQEEDGEGSHGDRCVVRQAGNGRGLGF